MANIGAIQRMLRSVTRIVVVVLALSCLVSGARADARSDFLIRMLSTSTQFRVRAQAALALGSQAGDKAIVRALAEALRDEHPAVRAASAAALERLGDVTAIPALKAAQSDRDGAVRTAVRAALASLDRTPTPRAVQPEPVIPVQPEPPAGTPSFYVGIGPPGPGPAGLSPASLRALREHLSQQVGQISGVLLAPENEPSASAQRVLLGQKLVGYYLDSSVISVETRPDGGLRAQVSVIVGTYPGRDMRAMLSGAATVMGGGAGEEAKMQAIQAAFVGALRRLPQAMQAGLARAP